MYIKIHGPVPCPLPPPQTPVWWWPLKMGGDQIHFAAVAAAVHDGCMRIHIFIRNYHHYCRQWPAIKTNRTQRPFLNPNNHVCHSSKGRGIILNQDSSSSVTPPPIIMLSLWAVVGNLNRKPPQDHREQGRKSRSLIIRLLRIVAAIKFCHHNGGGQHTIHQRAINSEVLEKRRLCSNGYSAVFGNSVHILKLDPWWFGYICDRDYYA